MHWDNADGGEQAPEPEQENLKEQEAPEWVWHSLIIRNYVSAYNGGMDGASRRASLRARLEAVERRLDRVERGSRMAATTGETPSPEPLRPWVVDVLAARTGPAWERDETAGSILYAGATTTPGTGPLRWQVERPVPYALDRDWAPAAIVLAAFGHPQRLAILRELLLGARTTQELQRIDGMGTAGQVYHHLRELQAAGLVRAAHRNDYRIPPDRVIPCLVIVSAAEDMVGIQPNPAPDEEGPTSDDRDGSS